MKTRKNRIRTGIIYALTGILVPLLAIGCSGSSRKEKNERIVTVTIEPQRYFAEAIAGDKFKIVSIVPKGSSPETYDPTPQQLVSLGDSKAYLRIGHIGFETTWMEKLTENTPHLLMFDTSEGIDLIRGTGHAHGDHFHPGGIEPHVWSSAVNAKIIARNMYNAFCTLDKENEEYYLARYDSLNRRIHATDSLVRDILSNHAGKTFMIYHPALSYFARDYSLQQIAIEEEGKEPSPAHLKKLIDTCLREEVKVIFIQPEFDRRNAEIVAEQTQAKIIPIHPLAYNWEEEMIHIAKSLTSEE